MSWNFSDSLEKNELGLFFKLRGVLVMMEIVLVRDRRQFVGIL